MKTGCVFRRGIYMGEAITKMAKNGAGFRCEEADETTNSEWHWDAVVEAIFALNKTVAEEGFQFGYGERGDFMYMPIEWWGEE